MQNAPFQNPALAERCIVLGVCGSIAAYRAADFTRHLQRAGLGAVKPILSKEAGQFVSPLVLSSLSKLKAETELHALDAEGVPQHISLAQWGEALVIYAATANTLAKLAQGGADDLVSTTALCFHEKPVVIVPAMNVRMWQHPFTMRNIDTLKTLPNVHFVEPTEGLLACGETGTGHLAPDVWTMLTLAKALHPNAGALRGKKVLVSAGGTQEPWDVARVITNKSSGKMGLALADEAFALGAEVTLITANTAQVGERPYATLYTPDARSMSQALHQHFPDCDFLLMAAAVSDFHPLNAIKEKLKKAPGVARYTLELGLNEDILAGLCAQKRPGQFVLGFAAESDTDNLEALLEKLKRKGCDALAINNVAHPGLGFNSEVNAFTLLFSDERMAPVDLPQAHKSHLAALLLEEIFAKV